MQTLASLHRAGLAAVPGQRAIVARAETFMRMQDIARTARVARMMAPG